MNDLYDRPPPALMARGRVALVGDAAHPMTPDLGQGGCQAIEDAVVLGECFGMGGTVEGILTLYGDAAITPRAGCGRRIISHLHDDEHDQPPCGWPSSGRSAHAAGLYRVALRGTIRITRELSARLRIEHPPSRTVSAGHEL